jgi:hypothetical protein
VITRTRKLAASVLATAMLALTAFAPAAAAQVEQDGLVNVNVGDVTILEDVNVAVAANLVATICNIDVEAVVAVIATVEGLESGATQQACRVGGGRGGQTISIEQN